MSSRKISNVALAKVLNGSLKELKTALSFNQWFIENAIPVLSWSDGTKPLEYKARFAACERITAQVRDIEHAIAALDEEKDDSTEA